MNIEELNERSELGHFLNRNGMYGCGVEVGSLSGGYAREILSTWEKGRLIMVDLWAPQPPEVYKERQDWTDFDLCYRECWKLVVEYDTRASMIRADSLVAAADFPDNYCDFVYIDANHAYGAVRSDLDAWYPKVRSGGIFAGHDFWNDTKWPSYGQVKDAVTDWNRLHPELKMHHTPKCGSWWFAKP